MSEELQHKYEIQSTSKTIPLAFFRVTRLIPIFYFSILFQVVIDHDTMTIGSNIEVDAENIEKSDDDRDNDEDNPTQSPEVNKSLKGHG